MDLDLEIHEDNLVRECVRHPRMVERVARTLAEATRTLALKERDLEVLKAEIESRIRSDPEKYGIEKPTEAAFKAAIMKSPKIDAAAREIIELEFERNLIIGANRTLDHRKRNLTDIVNLHGQNYFGDIKPTAEGREAVDKASSKKMHGVKKRRSEDEDDQE